MSDRRKSNTTSDKKQRHKHESKIYPRTLDSRILSLTRKRQAGQRYRKEKPSEDQFYGFALIS